MAEKVNLITESWERSSSKEREEFLRELHKRYRLERICRALSTVTDSELGNGFWCKENERGF
jgi:seryl-tRNA(Sec) selenium transferase